MVGWTIERKGDNIVKMILNIRISIFHNRTDSFISKKQIFSSIKNSSNIDMSMSGRAKANIDNVICVNNFSLLICRI